MTDSDDRPPRELPGGIAYVYDRLAAALEGRIRAGEWPYGARLPSRYDLAAEYGVAELTVRRAWRVLEERGLIQVLPSRGVFVTFGGHGPGT